MSRQRPAHRTRHRRIPSASRDDHRVTTVRHVHDDQHRQSGKHRADKGVDVHHKILTKDGCPASPPSTGQSRTSYSPPGGLEEGRAQGVTAKVVYDVTRPYDLREMFTRAKFRDVDPRPWYPDYQE
ncbi:hypothetical protein ACWD0J_07840 [Streptomyces sp. NPDC003011]